MAKQHLSSGRYQVAYSMQITRVRVVACVCSTDSNHCRLHANVLLRRDVVGVIGLVIYPADFFVLVIGNGARGKPCRVRHVGRRLAVDLPAQSTLKVSPLNDFGPKQFVDLGRAPGVIGHAQLRRCLRYSWLPRNSLESRFLHLSLYKTCTHTFLKFCYRSA